jgi:hypothetical protein
MTVPTPAKLRVVLAEILEGARKSQGKGQRRPRLGRANTR